MNPEFQSMPEAIAPTIAPMPARERLETLIADILAEARVQGVTAAEAAVSFCQCPESRTVRLGEVETLEHHRQRGLAVTVYFRPESGSPVLLTGDRRRFDTCRAPAPSLVTAADTRIGC